MKFWKKQSDPLVEETLAFAQQVVSAKSNRDIAPAEAAELIETVLRSSLPKPKDRLYKDEELQNRLSEFKAVQNRFERERDEYFKKTMAKVRSS